MLEITEQEGGNLQWKITEKDKEFTDEDYKVFTEEDYWSPHIPCQALFVLLSVGKASSPHSDVLHQSEIADLMEHQGLVEVAS